MMGKGHDGTASPTDHSWSLQKNRHLRPKPELLGLNTVANLPHGVC